MSAKDDYAPIALFVYRRLNHTRATVESLLRNPESAKTDLYVFSDGAKSDQDSDQVSEVRKYVHGIKGFRELRVIERDRNFGLSGNIISGVTDVLIKAGRIIVVEDDLVCSPVFLQYMNDGLTVYANADCVASIHGYVYPVNTRLPETFFLRGADCWGWATWARAWKHFNADGTSILRCLESENLTYQFDLEGAYPYTQMLHDQVSGANDSWAIRWHASMYLAGMFTLYPGRSVVKNIGNDASGTHCNHTKQYDVHLQREPINVCSQPVTEYEEARSAIASFLRSMTVESTKKTGFVASCWAQLRRFLRIASKSGCSE
jgi:hypothetical protein